MSITEEELGLEEIKLKKKSKDGFKELINQPLTDRQMDELFLDNE